MLIRIDTESHVPPFEQLRIQITALVIAGELQAGARLPSIRQLAGDLGLAGGTVARAYRELEAEGLVRSRGARGTAIVGPPAAESDTAVLIDAAREFAAVADRSDSGIDAAIGALRVAFATLRTQPS
jgi:GntR family transcriptional regulator